MKPISGIQLMRSVGNAIRGYRVEVAVPRALPCHERIARICKGWEVAPSAFANGVWHFEGGGTLSVKVVNA